MNDGQAPLESWKEIASYLQRDITTARRWEKKEGLPVHRHTHERRSSVYALPSEIDAWKASRKLVPEPAPVRPLWKIPAFALTMLLCLIMVGNGVRPMAAQQSGQIVQQVWAGVGVDAEGQPSPDGRYLSYVNTSHGDSLALHDLMTGENRDLTHGGGAGYSPVFTPDGKQIVFHWEGSDKSESLKMIDTEGSHERTVVEQNIWPRAVSPDSSLAVGEVDGESGNQLALVNLTSGKVTVLKSLDWRKPGIGGFSPDGRYVVYSLRVTQDSAESEIYALAVDGSSETKLVSPPGANGGPLFTPDGSRVVFTSDRTGRPALWSIRVSAGKPVGEPELVKADFAGESMGFTRNGSLYFSQRVSHEEALTAEVDPATWTVKGTARRILDRKIEGSSAAPTWSPDGKWIAYVSDRGRAGNGPGDATFVVRSVESGSEREFTAKVRRVQAARGFHWFPDSKALVFADYGPQSVFERLDLQTGEIRKLFSASPQQFGLYYAVSHDGRGILYPATERLAGRTSDPNPFLIHLMRHDVETGEEKELTQFRIASEYVFGLSESPDGRYIAYFSPDTPDGNSVWLVSLAGGEQREVSRVKGDRWFITGEGIGWDPQGRGIVCKIGDKAQRQSDLWYVPIQGGEPHKLGIDVSGGRFPNFSPDGRNIAFSDSTGAQEVWTLKNGFTGSR